MNFDRSAVPLRLYMEKFSLIVLAKLTGCKTLTFLYACISLCKTCDPWGWAIFGPLWHNLNELNRGSLDDAT